MQIKGWQRRDLALYGLVLVCLCCSFGSRVDNIVMAPMFLGALWQGNRLNWQRGIALAATGILAVPLASLLFGVGEVVGQPDQAELFAKWFAPSRYYHFAWDSTVRFSIAASPAIVIAAIASAAIALRKRQWWLLLLTVPVAMLDAIFWIPNGERERHFLGVIPALAILIGYGFAACADGVPNGRRIVIACGVASLGLLLAVSITGSDIALYLAALPMALPSLICAARLNFPHRNGRVLAPCVMVILVLALVVAARDRLYGNQIPPGADPDLDAKALLALRMGEAAPLYVIAAAPPLAAHIQRLIPSARMSQTPIIPS
ncbi:MAG: hypothetical protein ABIQ66_10310, partial [Novosphingobium sp.]